MCVEERVWSFGVWSERKKRWIWHRRTLLLLVVVMVAGCTAGVLLLQSDFLVHRWRCGCRSVRVDGSDRLPLLFCDHDAGLSWDCSENQVWCVLLLWFLEPYHNRWHCARIYGACLGIHSAFWSHSMFCQLCHKFLWRHDTHAITFLHSSFGIHSCFANWTSQRDRLLQQPPSDLICSSCITFLDSYSCLPTFWIDNVPLATTVWADMFFLWEYGTNIGFFL